MVFSLGKLFLSDEELISFKCYNALGCAKIGTNDVTSQFKLVIFRRQKSKRTASLINVINKLMYL